MTNKLAIGFLMSELFSLFPGLFDKLPIEAKDFSDEVEKIIKKHKKGGGYVSLHYIYSLFRTTGYIFCLSVILGSTSLISDWTCWRSLIQSSASDMIALISRRREGLTFRGDQPGNVAFLLQTYSCFI